MKEKGLRTVLATNPIFPNVATVARTRWAGLSVDDFDLGEFRHLLGLQFGYVNRRRYIIALKLRPRRCIRIAAFTAIAVAIAIIVVIAAAIVAAVFMITVVIAVAAAIIAAVIAHFIINGAIIVIHKFAFALAVECHFVLIGFVAGTVAALIIFIVSSPFAARTTLIAVIVMHTPLIVIIVAAELIFVIIYCRNSGFFSWSFHR